MGEFIIKQQTICDMARFKMMIKYEYNILAILTSNIEFERQLKHLKVECMGATHLTIQIGKPQRLK